MHDILEELREVEAAFLKGYMQGLADGERRGKALATYGQTLLSQPVEALALSQDVLNRLQAFGCEQIEDVVLLPQAEIGRMGAGDPQGAAAIARSLQAHGICHTPWKPFLL